MTTSASRNRDEFISALVKHFLGRSPDPNLLHSLRMVPRYGKIIRVLETSTEHRLNQQFLSRNDLPATPPRHAVFEHIMKTGGTTINSVLRRLYPLHVVSPHIGERELTSDHARWTIVTGHIGKHDHQKLPDLSSRRKVTLFRNPRSWVVSVYRYWRHDIGPEHPDYQKEALGLARNLTLSEFIRSTPYLKNHQAQCVDFSGEGTAADALSYFDVTGTTEHLERFLERILVTLEISQKKSARELIDLVPHNRSSGMVEALTTADEAYIDSHWDLDTRLYREALAQDTK